MIEKEREADNHERKKKNKRKRKKRDGSIKHERNTRRKNENTKMK